MKPAILEILDDAKMGATQWAVVIIAIIGLIFDGFDYQATAYAVPLIRQQWHLEPKVIGLLISSGFFGLFFGSVAAGYLADLIGRKKAFALCIFVYSIFTAIAALAPNFNWFVAMRFLTGIGLGGLVPISAAWVSEFLPARIRAAATAAVMGCFLAGWIFASGTAFFIIPDFGWRAFFFIGSFPALLAVFLIFWGPESPMWLISKGHYAEAQTILKLISPNAPEAWALNTNAPPARSNWLNLFSKQWITSTIIIGLLFFLIATVSAGVTQWLPTLLVDRGITMRNSYLYSFVVSLGPVIGTVIMGYLLDIVGRRLMFTIFWAAAALFIVLFAFATSPSLVMLFGFGLMFFEIATFTCLDVCTVEHYPTDLRASAVGWGLGISRLGGAFGPILGGHLIAAHISYAGFFLIFAVAPLINILLIRGLRLPRSRPNLLQSSESTEA